MTNSQGHQGGTGTWIAELPKPFALLLFVVCERAWGLTNPLSCYFIPIVLFAVDEHRVFQRYKICSYPHWIWAIHGCTVYLCTIGRQEMFAFWHAYAFKLCLLCLSDDGISESYICSIWGSGHVDSVGSHSCALHADNGLLLHCMP